MFSSSKQVFLGLAIFISFFSLKAQSISNLNYRLEQDKIVINYQLQGEENQFFRIQVYSSHDDYSTPIGLEDIVDQQDFMLKFGINSNDPIKTVTSLINGVPISSRGLKVVSSEHDFDEVVEQTISLSEGENQLKIIVETENGLVTEEYRTITLASVYASIINRRDFALLFASDEYDEWGNLVNPINDARTIAGELEKNYGFQVDLVTNADLETVWKKLREYSEKSYQENDQVFIFFAGHGQYDEGFDEGFLVTTDSKKEDIGKSSYISYNRLRPVIDRIPAKHIFLSMDACFGGTFDPMISQSSLRGEEDGLYKEITQLEYISRKLQHKTRRFLTSGGLEYVPDGRPGMHSPFARKLIEALRSYGGNDGVLTTAEIISYVEKINPEPRAGEFGSNDPGSDFVFVFKQD